MSLAMAAQRIGCELIRVHNSQDIIAAAPDFVLAIEPGQPKTTDVPTFGVVHSPRSILLESKSHLEDISYLQSLLTYDGYLTIADSLRNFIEALSAGAGRTPHVGFYYNTPQRQGLLCGLEKLAAQEALRLCYFGINWEPRARPLFRALAAAPVYAHLRPARGVGISARQQLLRRSPVRRAVGAAGLCLVRHRARRAVDPAHARRCRVQPSFRDRLGRRRGDLPADPVDQQEFRRYRLLLRSVCGAGRHGRAHRRALSARSGATRRRRRSRRWRRARSSTRNLPARSCWATPCATSPNGGNGRAARATRPTAR